MEKLRQLIKKALLESLGTQGNYKSDADIAAEFNGPRITQFDAPGKLNNKNEGMIAVEFPDGDESVGGGASEVVEYYYFYLENKTVSFKVDHWYPSETYQWMLEQIIAGLARHYNISEDEISVAH